MQKPFMTFEEQIQKLESKHLIIQDKELAMYALKTYGYYPLICGYKEPFKNKETGNYKVGTTLERIILLYQFDEDMRFLFLRYLLLVENKIKVCLANAFCEYFSEAEEDYLSEINYDDSTQDNRKEIAKLIKALEAPERKGKHAYINHARTAHNNVPLWVLLNAITFGSVSVMYKLQKQAVKARIAQEYPKLNEGNLGDMLYIASECRNTCAHSERLFTFKKREAIPKMKMHEKLQIPLVSDKNEYVSGQRDLFAVVIALRYLLDNEQFKAFKKNLAKTVDKYNRFAEHDISSIIMHSMGFPENWKNITRYRAY